MHRFRSFLLPLAALFMALPVSAFEGGPNAALAPPGAVVLFDGKDMSGWTKRDGRTPAAWKVADGAMTTGGGMIGSGFAEYSIVPVGS